MNASDRLTGPERTASPRRAGWGRALAWAAAAVALALVFTAYRDPHLMVDLAARVWACL